MSSHSGRIGDRRNTSRTDQWIDFLGQEQVHELREKHPARSRYTERQGAKAEYHQGLRTQEALVHKLSIHIDHPYGLRAGTDRKAEKDRNYVDKRSPGRLGKPLSDTTFL